MKMQLRKTLVDMKLPKSKITGQLAEVPPISREEYPYGLRITLDKLQIGKMGIDLKKISVGDKATINAVAKVVRISSTEGPDSDSKSLELQITKLAVE